MITKIFTVSLLSLTLCFSIWAADPDNDVVIKDIRDKFEKANAPSSDILKPDVKDTLWTCVTYSAVKDIFDAYQNTIQFHKIDENLYSLVNFSPNQPSMASYSFNIGYRSGKDFLDGRYQVSHIKKQLYQYIRYTNSILYVEWAGLNDTEGLTSLANGRLRVSHYSICKLNK